MARCIRRIIHIKGTETVIGLTSPQEPISKPVVHFTAKQVCTTKAFKTERLSVQLKPITFPTKMYSVMLDHKYLIMLYKQYLEGLFPQRKKYQPRADRSNMESKEWPALERLLLFQIIGRIFCFIDWWMVWIISIHQDEQPGERGNAISSVFSPWWVFGGAWWAGCGFYGSRTVSWSFVDHFYKQKFTQIRSYPIYFTRYMRTAFLYYLRLWYVLKF